MAEGVGEVFEDASIGKILSANDRDGTSPLRYFTDTRARVLLSFARPARHGKPHTAW
jgi:hypothetical protein